MELYLQRFRDPRLARTLVEAIDRTATRPWNIMEVCGGQTHAIYGFGIDELLASCRFPVTLLHGPGCPVCVTSRAMVDRALAIAKKDNVIFTSFGDMMRVPGTECDLLSLKAQGAVVKPLISPLLALPIAKNNPDKEIVFFGVGFETTAPVIALAIDEARKQGIGNFSVLASHVLVPPALEALLADPENRIDAFLAAGHVCTVMGYEEYFSIARKHKKPIVVSGFEPLDILQSILMDVTQLEEGRHEVENQYTRVVRREGNVRAQETMRKVLRVADQSWRGLGEIPQSGLVISDEYREFDALVRFPEIAAITADEDPDCRAGLVLAGKMNPEACPLFGTVCTPENPRGALMVSKEGTCAAAHARRMESVETEDG